MAVVRSSLWKLDPIQSFIIFDAEYTGLEQTNFKQICLLGVLRGDIASGGTELPRTINKLVLYFDQEKDDLHSMKTTGLPKGKLFYKKAFNAEAVDCLTSFIDRFPKPVCLVAHNGNKFAFAVLNSQLKKISQNLPKHLLCADTSKACKEFEPERISFSLERVFKRYFDCAPPAAHKTEVDCEMLLKIVMKKQKKFLKWMDSRALPLQNTQFKSIESIDLTDEIVDTSSGIQTFVIFDTETTGLPYTMPKITELCFLGVRRKDLLEGPLFPRVMDKILLYADPGKRLEFEAVRLTGLNNKLLAQEKPFDKDLVQFLCLFLKRLPKPVCLLAHNGKRFDFPLLMSELRQVEESLPDDLLCADTLAAFKTLEPTMTFPGRPGDETSPDEPSCKKTRFTTGHYEADDFRQRETTKEKSTRPRRLSYTQGEVYKRCMGGNSPNCHKAEDDCESLLKIVRKFSPSFLKWADDNANFFNGIDPMY